VSGKEYIKQALDIAEAILSDVAKAEVLNGDPLIESAHKAFGNLNQLKSKATLRTKEGTGFAFPVLEAAQNLEEAWEDSRANDDVDDLKWRLEGFIDAVVALDGALKDRTVIMT
jgi:hypothetical protein